MSARENIYSRLRAQSGSGDRDGQLHSLRTRIMETSLAGPRDTRELFERRAVESGSTVLNATSPADVPSVLCEALPGLMRIVLASDPLMERTGLQAALIDHGAEDVMNIQLLRDVHDASGWKRRLAGMDAGIATACAGIADSGAVVLRTSAAESRSLTLLPRIHVALLPVQWIQPSLLHVADLLKRGATDAAGSALTIVGGPSKTADIEKVLVTGVHGPARFVVVLIEDAGELRPSCME